MSIPERIHILGGPGIGKTHLAAELSDKLAVPRINLDALCWDDTYRTRTSYAERAERMYEISEQPSWIIEGAYCRPWLFSTLEAADTILHLETDRLLQRTRLSRRIAARAFRGEGSLAQARDLLGWVEGFENDVETLFPEELNDKVIKLSSKAAIRQYTENPVRSPA